MRKNVFAIISLVLFLVMAFVCIYSKSRPLPIEFSKVSKVEFYENRGLSETVNIKDFEQFKLLSLENSKDITSTNQIFKNAKGDRNDSPSCPFGLQIIFYEGNKKTYVDLGTDDCGFLIYSKMYYKISENDFKALQEFLKQHGIDIHKYI